jgi:hypothetical protein
MAVADAQCGGDAPVFVGHVTEFLLIWGQQAFPDSLEFDEAEVIDLLAVLLVPLKQSVAMDAELVGDLAETDVLGAQFDEFVTGFIGIHSSAILDLGFSILDLAPITPRESFAIIRGADPLYELYYL